MLRNARLRRRFYLRLATVLLAILSIVALLVAAARTSTISEQVRASRIISQASREARETPPHPTTQTDNREPAQGENASEALVSPFGPKPYSLRLDVTRQLLSGLLDRPPWFEPETIQSARDALNKLREGGLAGPQEEALDPDKYSTDELRHKICATLNAPVLLASLQEFSLAAVTTPSDEMPPGHQEARELLAACARCEIGDGNPEAAVARFLEAFRIPRTPGRPDADRLWATRLLPGLFDMFPGAVPAETAKQLLEIVDAPVDLAPEKSRIRLEQAETAQDLFESRLEKAKDSFFMNLNLDEGLGKLNEPNIAQGLLDTTERALCLLETPPYQAAAEFDRIEREIQSTANVTTNVVRRIRGLSNVHHCALAMVALAHTAVALKQYKSEHGSYPETLDGLTPPPPIDPFSGQPMTYKRDGEGFSILPQSQPEPHRVSPPSWTARR